MLEITLTNVVKRWGRFYGVDNLNLAMEDNSFITLLGPSGCGKTTILRMIAGLETPTSGRITIGDRVVFDSEAGINVPANKRKVGFLFQNYALWPNMTVYENISFGLTNIKERMPRVDTQASVCKSLIAALADPEALVRLAAECSTRTGQTDTARVLLKYIDYFTVSMPTAQKLLAYRIHEASNPAQAAASNAAALRIELDGIAARYAQNGQALDEQCRVTEGGAVVTEVRKLTKEEIDLTVRRVSRIVKIGMFMDRYPAELSGGQQQRVAIARTLAPEPQVLFMDEPLSNLDAKLRLDMRYELQRLHVETGSTFVYVTHDQMEAMTLATKICLINNGVLQQYDAPLTVYSRPNNLFAADFVGNPSINFAEAKGAQAKDGALDLTVFDTVRARFVPSAPLDIAAWQAARDARTAEEAQKAVADKINKDEVFKYHIARVNEDDYALGKEPEITNQDFVLGIRPETIRLDPDGELEGTIYGAMPTGMESTIKLRVGEYLLTGVIFGNEAHKIGTDVRFRLQGDGIMLFDRASGRLIATGTLHLRQA